MSKSTRTAPVAADVRAFFQADEKRMARLTDEARKTVEKGARGRLSPKAIAAYNKGRKADRRYTLGATTASTKARAEQRATLAASGVKVGKRGPLSKAALAALPKG